MRAGGRTGIRDVLWGAILVGAFLTLPADPVGAQVANRDSVVQDRALLFAQAWVNSDAGGLEQMMASSGVRLQLPGEESLSVLPGQARAAISSFMKRYQGGEAELFGVSQARGDADSWFAEFRWTCEVSGLRAPVIFSLFVAFHRDGPHWTVTEIRVLS